MLDAVAYQGNSEKVWVLKKKSEALLLRWLDCQFMAGILLCIFHLVRIKSLYSLFVNLQRRQDLGDDLQYAIDCREFLHTLYIGRKL